LEAPGRVQRSPLKAERFGYASDFAQAGINAFTHRFEAVKSQVKYLSLFKEREQVVCKKPRQTNMKYQVCGQDPSHPTP
jgi:hypothetical protein